MASLPLANQVRQVYVVSTLKDALPSALGDLAVKGEVGKFLYFQHFGQGGLTATDKIDVENIRSIKQTAAAEMKDYLKTYTVKVTEVSAGQVYTIKVLVRNYIGQGVYDQVYRYGMYKAKPTDDAAAIAAGLAADMQKALGLDDPSNASDITHYKEQLFTVTVSSDTVTIGEATNPYWELGKFPLQYYPVEIFLNGIVTDSEFETYDWATVAKGSPIEVNNVGKKMAELEYNTHGWRGDRYGLRGYPYNTTTKYMVDASSNSYDTIDIHYFFRGQGVSSQLSEKEITLIVPAGNSTILGAINDIIGDDAVKVVAPETYPRSTGN